VVGPDAEDSLRSAAWQASRFRHGCLAAQQEQEKSIIMQLYNRMNRSGAYIWSGQTGFTPSISGSKAGFRSAGAPD
jgi:hypothetical protein